MRTSNIFISLILLAFSGIYAVLIYQLPDRNLEHTLGAAFMPWLLTGFLSLLSLLLLLNSLFGKNDPPQSQDPIRPKDLAGIAGLLALILIFIFLTDYLGFFLSAALFLAALIFISGSRKPSEIIIFSLLSTGAVYLLFQKFFNVPLPAGLLF